MPKRSLRIKKFHIASPDGYTVFATAGEISDLLDVSESTVYRWRKFEQFPKWARELLAVKLCGWVPGMPEIHVENGELFTFSGHRLNSEELNQYGRLLPQVNAMARRSARLEDENKRLRAWLQDLQPVSQPTPAEVRDGRAKWYKRAV